MSKTKQQILNTTNSSKDLNNNINNNSDKKVASTVSPNSNEANFVATTNENEGGRGAATNEITTKKTSSPWKRRTSGAESMRSVSKKKQQKKAASSSSSSLSNSKQELNNNNNNNNNNANSTPKTPPVNNNGVVDVNNNEIATMEKSSSSPSRPISPETTHLSISDTNDLMISTPTSNRGLVSSTNNSASTSGFGSLLGQSNLSPNLTSLSLNPYVPPHSTLQQLQQQPQSSQKPKAKENDRFHQLFPSVPLDEYVIDTYSCAYAKSLNLYQGVMFVTSNYICFYSKILNHTNILIIKFSHINSITKSMHAVIFPTAIRIETHNGIYSFTSFRSRSHTLDHLADLLQKSRQRQVNEQCLLQRNKRLMQAAAAANKLSPNSTSKLEESNESSLLNTRRVTSYTIDTEIIESATSSANTTTMSNESDPNSSGSGGLKMSTSSPVIVNSQQPNANVNKSVVRSVDFGNSRQVQNQFQLFNKGVFNNNNYYDYCYGQQIPTDNLFYDFDFSGLSKNMVTVSLRHRQTLSQKIKLLLSILVPGFFNISRIDALLPICFIMCVLLLLNAFVLLNKVNQVDEIFTKLLTKNDL